jgi:hypothetical protein
MYGAFVGRFSVVTLSFCDRATTSQRIQNKLKLAQTQQATRFSKAL